MHEIWNWLFTEKGDIFKNVQSLDRTSDAGQRTNPSKSKQVSVKKDAICRYADKVGVLKMYSVEDFKAIFPY